MVQENSLITPILSGPTATGKSGLAIEFCKQAEQKGAQIEIINADSLLVYRGCDIGTAKPTLDEQNGIAHHLMDIRNPDAAYNAGDFVRDVQSMIQTIHMKKRRALIVGGTGFYLKALRYGMWGNIQSDQRIKNELDTKTNSELFSELKKIDDTHATKIGSNDRYRLIRSLEIFKISGKTPSELQAENPALPDPNFPLLVIERPSSELFKRISERTHIMIKGGILEETQTLIKQYPNCRALSAVGYAQCVNYLTGKAPEGRKVEKGLKGLANEIDLATRQLVKRQRTWFKSEKAKLSYSLDAQKAELFHQLTSYLL